jgi:hypothetical protein
MRNPDPNGYLMAAAEKDAKNEAEDNVSVAQLLERGDKVVTQQKQATQELEGSEAEAEARDTPDKIEGTG